jgi:alkylation response protein AidB-like acyl-CoA dehydrogenase
LANAQQQARWLPGYITGSTIGAIAMSEPGAGSDLAGVRTSAVRDGDAWILNGAKTFNSAGFNSDLVAVVARTNPSAGHKGLQDFQGVSSRYWLSYEVLAASSAGASWTRWASTRRTPPSCTSTTYACRLTNLLGEENRASYHFMDNLPSGRLSIAIASIAIAAVAGARETWRSTLRYAKDRKAFGRPIGNFQHNRFVLAEFDTELDIAEQYVDRCLSAVVDHKLTAVEAEKAKWWCIELAKRVVEGCAQLHGGYGCMNEYKVAKDDVDTRVQAIFRRHDRTS